MQDVTPMHARKAALTVAFALKDLAKRDGWMRCCYALTLFRYPLFCIIPANESITNIWTMAESGSEEE